MKDHKTDKKDVEFSSDLDEEVTKLVDSEAELTDWYMKFRQDTFQERREQCNLLFPKEGIEKKQGQVGQRVKKPLDVKSVRKSDRKREAIDYAKLLKDGIYEDVGEIGAGGGRKRVNGRVASKRERSGGSDQISSFVPLVESHTTEQKNKDSLSITGEINRTREEDIAYSNVCDITPRPTSKLPKSFSVPYKEGSSGQKGSTLGNTNAGHPRPLELEIVQGTVHLDEEREGDYSNYAKPRKENKESSHKNSKTESSESRIKKKSETNKKSKKKAFAFYSELVNNYKRKPQDMETFSLFQRRNPTEKENTPVVPSSSTNVSVSEKSSRDTVHVPFQSTTPAGSPSHYKRKPQDMETFSLFRRRNPTEKENTPDVPSSSTNVSVSEKSSRDTLHVPFQSTTPAGSPSHELTPPSEGGDNRVGSQQERGGLQVDSSVDTQETDRRLEANEGEIFSQNNSVDTYHWPKSVHDKLAKLQTELEEELITKKGYWRKKTLLVEPFLTEVQAGRKMELEERRQTNELSEDEYIYHLDDLLQPQGKFFDQELNKRGRPKVCNAKCINCLTPPCGVCRFCKNSYLRQRCVQRRCVTKFRLDSRIPSPKEVENAAKTSAPCNFCGKVIKFARNNMGRHVKICKRKEAFDRKQKKRKAKRKNWAKAKSKRPVDTSESNSSDSSEDSSSTYSE